MKKVGLIINPIAGMGGRVGLKGTDGPEALRRAVALGATPEATAKAARALEKLLPLKDELVILTCAGDMGESIAMELGFTTEVVYARRGPSQGDGATDPRTDSRDDSGTAPRMDSGTDPRTDPRMDPGTDPRDGSGTAPRMDSGTDLRTDPRMDSGTDPRTDPRTDSRDDSGTAPRMDSGTDPRTDGAASLQTDPRTPFSSGDDTRAAAKQIAGRGVDLLLFAGGDGTARDIYESVGTEQVVLGIPAGVKIHSPVYANTPAQAGELALLYLTGGTDAVGEREVVDIDEEAVRRDVLQTALYGYLTVPIDESFMQSLKSPSPASEAEAQLGIAEDVIENMDADTCYIIGPGTTTRAIMQTLGLPFTLLGVDVVRNREVLGLDLAERELLQFAEKYPCKLVLTPTGGQGYLLGRGNQQISGAVIKRIGKENVIIVATSEKITQLRGKPLLVDTGDPEADELLAGYHRVKTGYWLETMHRIAAG